MTAIPTSSNRYRVAVTGLGVACPIGTSIEEYQSSLILGQSGIRPIESMDVTGLSTTVAAETQLNPDYLPECGDRKARFMYWAADKAYTMAFKSHPYKPEDGLLSLGIGLDLFSLPELVHSFHHTGLEGDPHYYIPASSMVPSLTKHYKCHQPPQIVLSACAASSDALGLALDSIRSGQSLWSLAGGTDSMINPMGFAAFSILGAMSRRNSPQSSRPFDKYRDGFVMGEGAGAIILERYDLAEKRGATILGELLGHGGSMDAYAISDPDPEGKGAGIAMEKAILDAGLTPDKIQYINAHGTSTPKNDVAETNAIKRVFHNPPPVSSTKSMIGHCIASAGVLEVIAVFLAQGKDYLPPTINLENPDPACDLDYIPNRARGQAIEYFLSNSLAFGGQNSSLVGRIIR
ncbi:MAG: beta-ketoacyl-[acyl-carrier-protein] synthase family protein [Spirochaetota bacterium]|nr:beta-ketoacyl-[acyl-carrier-protein] synthase family protein [Spirochaetota bacterium]